MHKMEGCMSGNFWQKTPFPFLSALWDMEASSSLSPLAQPRRRFLAAEFQLVLFSSPTKTPWWAQWHPPPGLWASASRALLVHSHPLGWLNVLAGWLGSFWSWASTKQQHHVKLGFYWAQWPEAEGLQILQLVSSSSQLTEPDVLSK